MLVEMPRNALFPVYDQSHFDFMGYSVMKQLFVPTGGRTGALQVILLRSGGYKRSQCEAEGGNLSHKYGQR